METNVGLVEPKITNEVDKAFFAEVKRLPAQELLPDFMFNSYNNTVIQVETSNGPVICNNCSDGYLLIDNRKIFPVLEKNMEEFGLSKINRTVIDNAVFFVDYDFVCKENKIRIAKKDFVFPRISIENSYNSKYLFKINACFMRQVCTNGLCLPIENTSFNTILSHSKGNYSKIIAESLEGIVAFLKEAPEIAGEYEVLMDHKVESDKIEEYVESILRKTNVLLSCKEDIVERVQKENQMGIETTLFSVYNGINYFLQPNHNEYITLDGARRRQMDEKVLDCCFDMLAN